MTLANPTTLVGEIRRELNGHQIMQAANAHQIEVELSTVESSMSQREGFDAGAVDLAASGLTVTSPGRGRGRGRGRRNPVIDGVLHAIGEKTVDVLGELLPDLLGGIGGGAPGEAEQCYQQNQVEYSDCVENLIEDLCAGASSMNDIVKSSDMSLSLVLGGVLRVLKLTRFTPIGLLSGFVLDAVVNGLNSAVGTSDDTNKCIATVLDQLEKNCREVCEVDETPDPGHPVAAPEPVAHPEVSAAVPAGSPNKTIAAQPAAGIPADGIDMPGSIPEIPTSPEAMTTHAASAGGLEINFNVNIDVNATLDLAGLQDFSPPSVSTEDVTQMMTSPLGEVGAASSLGGLATLNAGLFEACECPFEVGVAEPTPDPVPAPDPGPEPGPPTEEGVIPPPPELAEVEEPTPPPKKGGDAFIDPEVVPAGTQSSSLSSSIADTAPDHTPTPEPDPEPATRARKVETF
ncbi:hypothetical protein [Corynebacterium cystitidis]|uniref:hypothetical protein n=1 Tax=Corynebacterium cystitidis TaxID=35757 RepID=UPI00211E4BFD|nr:hypothetical protein [Corynebacterium cystitidis]